LTSPVFVPNDTEDPLSTSVVAPDCPDQQCYDRDWDLVRRAQAGDRDAYAELYTRHYDTVMGFLVNRLADQHLCEDLAADTFHRALRRIDSVSYQGRPVGTWFVTIARNLMLDDRKSARVRLERPMDDSPVIDLAVRDETANPVHEVTNNSLGELLRAAMDQLGADQREVLELRFLDNLSPAEASEVLQRNYGATKALQHRAVASMRRLLHPSVVDYLRS
jgi:RNA polymerase sigma-70 factor (ECF subfamily)